MLAFAGGDEEAAYTTSHCTRCLCSNFPLYNLSYNLDGGLLSFLFYCVDFPSALHPFPRHPLSTPRTLTAQATNTESFIEPLFASLKINRYWDLPRLSYAGASAASLSACTFRVDSLSTNMSASNPSTRVGVPPNHDPFAQNFTLIDSGGHTVIANVADLDAMRLYGVRQAINYGSQIGASVMLLLFLILLTKPAKRTSSIFIMNTLCLVLNTIRTIFQTLWLTGSLWNPYSNLANDTSRDSWQDRANTVTANTLTLCLLITIMTSLTMQVWVVCKAVSTLHRALIMGATTTVALVAVGFRFAVTVLSNMLTVGSGNMGDFQWLVSVMHIFQAVAIWANCSVFACKLGLCLIQRRRLGMTQFGPMQIVFIMSAQTMVIPGTSTCLPSKPVSRPYTDTTQLSSASFISTRRSLNLALLRSPSSASSFPCRPSGPASSPMINYSPPMALPHNSASAGTLRTVALNHRRGHNQHQVQHRVLKQEPL